MNDTTTDCVRAIAKPAVDHTIALARDLDRVRTYETAGWRLPAAERMAFVAEAEAQGCPIRYCPKSFTISLVTHPDGTGLLVFVSFDPWIRTAAHESSSFADGIFGRGMRPRFKVRRRPVPHARRIATYMQETTHDQD